MLWFFKVGPGDPPESPRGKLGIIYFHQNSIHKKHNDRMYDHLGHEFHTLSVIKVLKAKFLTDGCTLGQNLIKRGSMV